MSKTIRFRARRRVIEKFIRDSPAELPRLNDYAEILKELILKVLLR